MINRRVISDFLMGISLILSFFLALITLPGLGLAIGLLIPLSIAFYFRKLGRGYGMLMLGAVVVLAVSVAGKMVGGFFLAEFAVMGIALSEVVGMKLPLGRGVLVSAFASLIGSILLLAAALSSVDKGLPEAISEHIQQNVRDTIDAYKRVGLPEEQVKRLTELTERLETVILKTFPSLAFIGMASVAISNLLALKWLLKRKGIEEYVVEPSVWRSPEPLVWVLIAGGLLLLLKGEWARTMGLNLLIVSGGVYLFQGIAILSFYFKKMETPLILRIFGYLLVLFQQIFTILVIGFGLFDLWFDFRRLEKGGLDADNSYRRG